MIEHIEFVETGIFTKRILEYKAEEELKNLQHELSENPNKGDIIQGTGGLRKVRMPLPGKGKRGGARVIYYYMIVHDRIYLCFAYKKSKTENLTDEEKSVLRGLVEQIKKEA